MTKSKEIEPIIVKTSAAADFFSVSTKNLSHDWRKAGAPQIKTGTWNLKELFNWWWDNIASERAAKEGGEDSTNEAKRQYWWAKAQENQIKVRKEKKKLIEIEDVHRCWAQRMAEYKNGCYGLINALPPLLEGQTQAVMRSRIEEFVWDMFNRVVREGEFCKKETQKDDEKT